MNDYLVQIVLAAIGAAVLALLTLAWWAWVSKVKPWIDTRLTATQREIIERLARDAYEWVEKKRTGRRSAERNSKRRVNSYRPNEDGSRLRLRSRRSRLLFSVHGRSSTQ